MKKIISTYFSSNNIFSLISLFFFTFGLTLAIAIIFTTSQRGIIVNLICSIFFIISGVGAAIISKKSSEKEKDK